MTDALELDAVIFGGGVAGLWTLDELVRAGCRCLLLEAHELGSGQTVASQGIIHGGLKYTLGGWLSPSAKAIADMPLIWRGCLAGDSRPNLSATKVRAHSCMLWQTASLKSRLGMVGARAGLRIAPQRLAEQERPAVLAKCPGTVARLDEQVIEPWSLITDLSEQHRARIMKIDAGNGLEFQKSEGRDRNSVDGDAIDLVRLLNPETGEPLDLRPRMIVLAAGAGNAELRQMAGQPGGAGVMQRRPLHMVMLRGKTLAPLNGHCIDGVATRVTITSTRDFSNRPLWQIGGQIAERGVNMAEAPLLRHAREELQAVLPGLDLRGVEAASYRVDRAEAATGGGGGGRPDDISVRREGNIITAWPTKLALAPRLAREVCNMVGFAQQRSEVRGQRSVGPATSNPPTSRPPTAAGSASVVRSPGGWPRPVVALPPWETTLTWTRFD